MQNQFYLLIVMLCLAKVATAQNHPYEVRFSYQIELELAEQKISPTRVGLLYSFIGDYLNSIKYSEIPVSWGVDSLYVAEYSTASALSTIVEKAKNHQIVIISESHIKPQHRVFADKVIGELAKTGFEHLGLETFGSISNSNNLLDEALLERGYPLNSPLTGTYTMEPQMGKLVRNAIEAKFQLFAYERSEKIAGKDRDEIQADNIIRYLEANPNSKIIILCGFHHAIESDQIKRGKHYWMAKYLKDKTGLDPLTIYQDNFTEKHAENEHSILSALNISEPSVFVNDNGQVARLSEHVDIEVIHPKTTYVNNRPSWLYNSKTRSVEITADTELQFPMIVEAYPIGEVGSVPVDRVELKHKYDHKVLVLEAGNYRIVMKDGTKTAEYSQKID